MITSITVCSFNVGGWTDGTRSGLRSDELPARLAAWESFLADNDADFLLCEEASFFVDAARLMPAYETLFARRFPFSARVESGDKLTAAVLLCAKYPIENPTARQFASGSGRPFVTFDTVCGGRRLKFAVVHLSIEANSEGIRRRDLAELAALLRDGEIDVLTGDFNTFEIGEFDIFRPAAHLANHGAYGDFETWPHKAGQWNRCLDNVITGGALTLSDVRMGDVILSDHLPIFAQVGF